MPEVTTTFFANASQAEAALARLEAKYAQLENSVRQVGKRSKEASSEAMTQLGNWVMGVASIGTAFATLGTAINLVRDAQRQLREEADRTNTSYDELVRKLRVQGGLSAAQGQEAQGRLTAIASRTGVGFAVAQSTAEEMISQGFDVASGTGAGLERMLQTIRATNADPAQARQITQAYASLLAATGQDKTSENLEAMTRAVQRVFKGTPLQAPDLAALAPKIQGVSSVVPADEALAQFAVMREKASPDVAATALKLVWERLQTASVNATTQKGLATLSLSPADVDAIGEAPAEVLDRLAAGLAKIPETERPGVLSQLFGQEAMSAASGLIRDRAKVAEYVRLQKDEAGFQEDVRVATSGPAAARARAALIQDQYQLRAGAETLSEERSRAAMAILQQQGMGPGQIAMQGRQSGLLRFLGLAGPESMLPPGVLESALGTDTAGMVTSEQFLSAKVAELRGALPGGVTAERFLQEATGDLAGMTERERNPILQARLAALQGLEGNNVQPATAELLQETKEQTKLLREFLRKAAAGPRRKPGEGSE